MSASFRGTISCRASTSSLLVATSCATWTPAGPSATFATRSSPPTPTSAWARSSTALEQGADIVVTGRVTDTGLTLGPLFHEFGWRTNDWDKVAAGTVAGHIIECGAQSSGGNLLRDWRKVQGLANPGFPIVEASPDGTFVVTKHPKHRRYRERSERDGAAGLRDGRPALLHHAGRRRRLHHHPAEAGRQGPSAGERHQGRAEDPDAQGVDRLLLRIQGGGNAGLFLARGLRQGQGRRPHPSPAAQGPGARASSRS